MNVLRSDAVERRKPSHQHEVHSIIDLRLLHHQQIRRRFDDTQASLITTRRTAKFAYRLFREVVAAFAMSDLGERLIERASEPLRTPVVTLQQVESHALRRLRPDAGKAAQGFDQLFKTRRRFHRRPVPCRTKNQTDEPNTSQRGHGDRRRVGKNRSDLVGTSHPRGVTESVLRAFLFDAIPRSAKKMEVSSPGGNPKSGGEVRPFFSWVRLIHAAHGIVHCRGDQDPRACPCRRPAGSGRWSRA